MGITSKPGIDRVSLICPYHEFPRLVVNFYGEPLLIVRLHNKIHIRLGISKTLELRCQLQYVIYMWMMYTESPLALAEGPSLPFRTPGSVPHCGTWLCSNCWDNCPRTCHVFTRLFTSNTPWYFLDFALMLHDAGYMTNLSTTIHFSGGSYYFLRKKKKERKKAYH